MKHLLLVTLLLVSATGFAQLKLKTKRNTLSLIHQEVYQINKRSKQKHGYYFLVNTNTNDTLTAGQYDNGQKEGIWQYRKKDGSTYIEYDYSNDNLLSWQPKIMCDSTFIKVGSEYVYTKVDNPQIYLGVEHAICKNLASSITLSFNLMDKGKSGINIYALEIDETGSLKNTGVIKTISHEIDEMVRKQLKEMQPRWIPARKDGKSVTSRALLMIRIANFYDKAMDGPELPYLLKMQIVYGGPVKTTKSISTF